MNLNFYSYLSFRQKQKYAFSQDHRKYQLNEVKKNYQNNCLYSKIVYEKQEQYLKSLATQKYLHINIIVKFDSQPYSRKLNQANLVSMNIFILVLIELYK